MTYSVVPTSVTGQVWTATNQNVFARGNFIAGVPDIFTTKGDLAIASAADAASRLGVTTDNNHLFKASTDTLGVIFGADPEFALAAAQGSMLSASGVEALAEVLVGSDYSFLQAASTDANGVAWKSIIHARQGGSATDWSVAGTDTYIPTSALIQIGLVSGGQIIGFPTAYSERPFILVGDIGYWVIGNGVYYHHGLLDNDSIRTTTGFTSVLLNAGATSDNVDTNSNIKGAWIAIGAP